MKRTSAMILGSLVILFHPNIIAIAAFLQASPLPVITHCKENRNTFLKIRRWTRSAYIEIDPQIIVPPDIQSLVDDLEAVQSLPRIREDESTEDYNGDVPVCASTKPTFRRLFTHETWNMHVGGTTLSRWLRCLTSMKSSVILRAVSKTVLFLSGWAAIVSVVVPKLFSTAQIAVFKEQQLPLSLCGNAIGLLLVFRTNHAYRRLEEARDLMEKVIHLSGEVVSTLVSAWQPYSKEANGQEEGKGDINGDSNGNCRSIRTTTLTAVCRHLAAFAWSLRDELRDGDEREDVLELLLPRKEEKWVARQRSRALAIHGNLRRILYEERRSGRLSDTLHFIIEGNLKQLSGVAASCERLFSSPIPPTMSRHGLRSMTVWLMALPVVLAFSIPPVVNVAWTSVVAFVYLGIDELGVQVEQPFRVIPMWQLCQLVQEDIKELTLHPLDL